MSMFGEGVCAGHHGCRSFLQLSQFLPSLIQRYPRTGQVSNHPGRCTLHALHVSRAWNVLGQATGGFPCSRFTNYHKRHPWNVLAISSILLTNILGDYTMCNHQIRSSALTEILSVQRLSSSTKEAFEETSVRSLWCLHGGKQLTEHLLRKTATWKSELERFQSLINQSISEDSGFTCRLSHVSWLYVILWISVGEVMYMAWPTLEKQNVLAMRMSVSGK